MNRPTANNHPSDRMMMDVFEYFAQGGFHGYAATVRSASESLIELRSSHALLLAQNEAMRKALEESISEMDDAAKYIQDRSTLSSNAYADALKDVIATARAALNPPLTK